jgi:hypothetical protein
LEIFDRQGDFGLRNDQPIKLSLTVDAKADVPDGCQQEGAADRNKRRPDRSRDERSWLNKPRHPVFRSIDTPHMVPTRE